MISVSTSLDLGWADIKSHASAYIIFTGMLLAAMALSQSRLNRWLNWSGTFYHEISHGLICKLTGGMVSHIALDFRNGGKCFYQGGWQLPVAMAGYLGGVAWGGLIYLIGADMDGHLAHLWLDFELIVLAVVYLIWVKKADLVTTLIFIIMAAIYAAALVYSDNRYLPYVLQFMGLYVMVNGLEAPLRLIGLPIGDAADLQKMTWVPALVWVIAWFAFAVLTVVWCASQTLPGLAGILGWRIYL